MYMLTYSIIFSVIKAQSRILRHYQGLFRLIQGYLANCVTLTYSQPWDIFNTGIFRTQSLFKTLQNIDQTYLKPCHRGLFSHIQTNSERCAMLAYAETWHTQNPGISEIFHNCISMHVRNPVIFGNIYGYLDLI